MNILLSLSSKLMDTVSYSNTTNTTNVKTKTTKSKNKKNNKSKNKSTSKNSTFNPNKQDQEEKIIIQDECLETSNIEEVDDSNITTNNDNQASLDTIPDPTIIIKKKSRKKPRRKTSKAEKFDEGGNEISTNQLDSNETGKVQLENIYYFKYNEDKSIRLNTNDPQWETYKSIMNEINSNIQELESICESNSETILSSQEFCRESILKLNNDIKSNLNGINRSLKNDQYKTGLESSSDKSSKDFSVNVNTVVKNLEENNADFKNSVENKKGFAKFLIYSKEELQKLDDLYKKCLENARENSKKLKYYKRVIDLRKRLGLDENIALDKLYIAQLSFPAEVNNVFFAPLYIGRKISSLFAVDFMTLQEKSDKKKLTLSLAGLNKDVNNCIEYLKNFDFSGSQVIPLDSNKIGSLIGRGGSMIRKIENEFKVFINIVNENATLFGVPEDIAKLKSHLEDDLFKQTKEQIFYKVVDLTPIDFQFLSKYHSADIRKLGEDTNTIINMIDKGSLGRIGIKGKNNDDVEKALIELNLLKEEIVSFEMTNNAETINKLQKTSEFSNLINFKEKNCIILNSEGRLFVTGIGERVNIIKEKINNLINLLSFTPSTIKLHPAQWNLILKSNIDLSDTIRIINKHENSTFVDFYGSSEKTKSIQYEIDQFIKENAYLETIDIDKTLVNLIWDNLRVIRQLESTNEITIQMPTRIKNNIIIVGSTENVATAKSAIEKLISNGPLLTESIQIERHNISPLKGLEGATIKRIQSESGIRSINIDDNNLVVRLRGHSESIVSAKDMIEKILSNVKETNRKQKRQPPTNTYETTAAPTPLTTISNTNSTPQNIDLSSYESFPSLHDSMVKIH